MTDGKWHGWRTPEGTLRIGPVGGRVALIIEYGEGDSAFGLVAAYFDTENEAKEAMRLLDLLAVGVVDESNTGGAAGARFGLGTL